MSLFAPGKVLMVVENRPVPTDVRVWAEARALRELGLEVSIICPGGSLAGSTTHVCLQGIHIYYYRLPGYANHCLAYLLEYTLSLVQTWWLSLRVLHRHGFDVIHAANPPDMFFCLHWFYLLLGKRFVFDQHDLAPEVFQAKFGKRRAYLPSILRWMEKCSYRSSTCIITTNESQYRRAIGRGQCDPRQVFIVRNGPQRERLQPVPAEQELKRGRPYLLVYLGGMESQDGVEYALYTLHTLIYLHGRRDVSLALLGNGGYLPRLKQLARDLHIEAFTHFTGWVDAPEITRYLCAADIGLCPDPLNGLNEYCTTLKSMEYMALGLPIVAFDLVETRYTCQEAALYATPNSVPDFTNQVARLLEEPETRHAMGKRGRALIEERWSWEYSKQQLWHAYISLFPALSAVRIYSTRPVEAAID